ncbi:MAG: YceI family protein [Lutibacter sp.]|nr:YceI family protein [Lutibacter sp.]
MKNTILIIAAILSLSSAVAQNKYFTKNGVLTFEATVAAFEEIKSENNSVTAVLNIETHELAVLAPMKAFRFKIALMEEHFNENYVESDAFPKASFKGKLDSFDFSGLSETPKKIQLSGTLNIHNKDKEIRSMALVSLKNNVIMITTEFKVKPQDFDIKIPSIVQEKIAKEININVKLNLQKKAI